MVKRALCAVVGLFGLCLSLSAQQTSGPNLFSALNSNSLLLPSLALSDAESFSFPLVFAWVAPEPAEPSVDLPAITVKGPHRIAAASVVAPAEGPDVSKEVVKVRRPYFDYATGEIGAFYGSSSGKFGREVESGYILGEVGNDKLQISAGVSYEHSTGRAPRFGR